MTMCIRSRSGENVLLIRGVACDFEGVRTGRKFELLKALQTRGGLL